MAGFPFEQVGSVMSGLKVSASGCVILIQSCTTHALASVISMQYVPGARLSIKDSVAVNPSGPFHSYVYGAVPPVTAAVAVPLVFPLQSI